MNLVQWATLPMCYARQLRSLVEFHETQAEQLLSGDQAAFVIEGAAVTSKPKEVPGKVRTM